MTKAKMTKQEFERIPEKDRMNRVLTGTSYYAFVHNPDMKSAKKFNADPKFSIKLGLDDAGVAKAESYGLKVKPANEQIPMPWVEIKRTLKAGKELDKVRPEVVDSMQRAIPATILVGNQSTVSVKFGTGWYDTQGGGVTTYMWKVQVKKLVPYENNTDRSLDMDSEGFVVPDAASTTTADQEFDL